MIRWLRSLALLLLLTTLLAPTALARQRDPMAPVTGMSADEVVVFPNQLISAEKQQTIAKYVTEARTNGIPLAVRVIVWPGTYSALSRFPDGDETTPLPQDQMQRMAAAWLQNEPIESSTGADDGILLLVAVRPTHELSSAAFAWGPNALPVNGVTEPALDQVLTNQMLPLFRQNTITDGIVNGVMMVGYDALFGAEERLPINQLHADLQMVAGVPMATLTVLASVGLWGMMFWISRRPKPTGDPPASARLSPTAAAALTIGRVDDAVMAGGLLTLVDEGVLIPGSPFRLVDSGPLGDSFLDDLVAMLALERGPDGTIPAAVIRRIHDVVRSPRENLEDRLASDGLFNRDGKAELMWLVLGSLGASAIAIVSVLPSIIGTARLGIFATSFALFTVVVAMAWGTSRSWTTPRGHAAVRAWLSAATMDERLRYERMVHQDRFITNTEGWNPPARMQLARRLRGLGNA